MSDGSINFPRRASEPDTPAAGRTKIWVDDGDGKPKYTNDAGVTSPFGGLYGQNFQATLEDADATNNTTSFVTYDDLSYTVDTVSGFVIYEVNINFVWGYSAPSTDFRARLLVNGVQIGEEFRQEPKDGGVDQRQYMSLTVPVFGFQLGTVTGTIEFQFAASNAGPEARMFYNYMTIKRVS